jgi:hypothetical protein
MTGLKHSVYTTITKTVDTIPSRAKGGRMKLILTEEEKKAATWAELDDVSLGKVVKAYIFEMKAHCNEEGKIFVLSAAMALCVAAAEANADKFTQTIEGLTTKGKSLGNWRVTIRRMSTTRRQNDTDSEADLITILEITGILLAMTEIAFLLVLALDKVIGNSNTTILRGRND